MTDSMAQKELMLPFPPGHFYSPIVNPDDLVGRTDKLWPETLPHLPGIDFRDADQERFLQRQIGSCRGEFDYPDILPPMAFPYQFYMDNGLFSGLDALALFTMLRVQQPRRIIEVGSGFSSLLTADVNRRHFGNSIDFTCIEPYPRQVLVDGVPGISRMLINKVEDIALETFDALDAHDILFIDSSHVAKTGSDVNFLYFDVLPRLKPGVVIHIHDIFFPHDYPQEWVLIQNRSWNEQYLLRALLMYSQAFSVLFGSAYAYYRHPDSVRSLFGGSLVGGGSFWMQKN